MKKGLLLSFYLSVFAPAFGQVTLTFKPDANVGEDVTLWELHDDFGKDCRPAGMQQPVSNMNFGNSPESSFSAWTWNAAGCPRGTTRELIRFSELNTIPPGSTITGATLILRGPTPTLGWGNNQFPGTPLPNDNMGWLKRVLPGAADAWNENTVTWNTQPNTDPNSANWSLIGATGQRWGWTQTIDVTDLVSAIVQELATDPDANNGFLLQLQNENFYRSQGYASSDHADASLWPELVVSYNECNSGFGYCVSSLNPSVYDFTADNQNMVAYQWIVDGVWVGSGPTLNYDFAYSWTGSTTHKVCLIAEGVNGIKCERCLEVCGTSYVKNGIYGSCNPIFTYCTSTPNNQNYTFTAVNPGMTSYAWKIDGSIVGTGPVLAYSFPTIGDYEIVLEAYNGSTWCFSQLKNFCVSPVFLYAKKASSNETASEGRILHSTVTRGDDPVVSVAGEPVIISPNPAENGWNVDYVLTESDEVTITLSDIFGKQIKTTLLKGEPGTNRYYVAASEIASGMYFIKLKGKHIDTKREVIKL
ncbi:DNRLRE domain-containing protein [Fluviicola sp.]|uniref:DNRLRE domain-containing protein n=1 Tax=Fluviicola sp. TaxID=1917219 RepID=UPI00261F4D74|nr:DNRLRE domain-containing protein [Fluviicola sp.]